MVLESQGDRGGYWRGTRVVSHEFYRPPHPHKHRVDLMNTTSSLNSTHKHEHILTSEKVKPLYPKGRKSINAAKKGYLEMDR